MLISNETNLGRDNKIELMQMNLIGGGAAATYNELRKYNITILA